MSFYNTGNPVPSDDPRDLDDNAKHIDDLVNSTELTFTDRLGAQRKTLAGIEADADAATLRGDLAADDGAELVGYGSVTVSESLDTLISAAAPLFRQQIKTLDYLSALMHAGTPQNCTFIGDSTTDGTNTTGWVQNPTIAVTGFPWTTAPVANSDHNLDAPNAWPAKLQDILRAYHRNPNINCYNAGYSGQQMQNGWVDYYFEKIVLQNPFIPSPDVVFIGFGLNDTTDAGSKVLQHVAETIKVLKKVVDIGATPVLVTCDMNWRSFKGWTPSGSGRDNEEVAAQIDQAKKYMAKAFGVPIIDMDSFQKEWITKNSDLQSLAIVQADGLHFNDLGHKMKAGIAAKHFMPDIYVTDGAHVERIDWKDSRSRFAFANADSWTPPSNNEGLLYSRFPEIWYLGTDDYVASDLVMDAWIWSDGEQPSLIYRGFSNSNINETYTTPQLPIITVNWLSDSTPYYSKEIPQTGNKEAYASATDRPYYLTKLKYGLNRVRVYCPTVVNTIFWGGWFELNSEWKAKDTFGFYNNINGPSFVQTDGLRSIGPMYYRYPADTVNPQVAFVNPEMRDGSNVADIGQVGDTVDILVEGFFDTNTGFLFFGGKSLNTASGSADNLQEDNCLMLFANTSTSFNLLQLRYPLQPSNPFPTVQAGVAGVFADANRTFLIRCQRTSPTVQTITVYVGTNDNGTVALSYTGGWASGQFAGGGVIGGVYANRTSTRNINITRILVRKYK